jgi:hypothetical protein
VKQTGQCSANGCVFLIAETPIAYKLQSGKLASYFVAVIHGILAQVANRAGQPFAIRPAWQANPPNTK